MEQTCGRDMGFVHPEEPRPSSMAAGGGRILSYRLDQYLPNWDAVLAHDRHFSRRVDSPYLVAK